MHDERLDSKVSSQQERSIQRDRQGSSNSSHAVQQGGFEVNQSRATRFANDMMITPTVTTGA